MRTEEKFATFSGSGRTKNLATKPLRRFGFSVAAWSCLVLGGLCFYLPGNVSAQEALPRPEPKFKGTIDRTYVHATSTSRSPLPMYLGRGVCMGQC
jgi:hypothetical protein